jgi:hypothetical protein
MKGPSILRAEAPRYTLLPEQNLIRGVLKDYFWEDLDCLSQRSQSHGVME